MGIGSSARRTEGSPKTAKANTVRSCRVNGPYDLIVHAFYHAFPPVRSRCVFRFTRGAVIIPADMMIWKEA